MRGTQLHIRPHAMTANLQRVQQQAGSSKIVAMLKANGYGHGLLVAANAFAAADRLGVAVLEEARYLRAAGITTPLLLAEGVFDADELVEAAALGQIATVVHSPWQVDMLAASPVNIDVWLKHDTGMHRLGMQDAVLQQQFQRLAQLPQVNVTTLITHLACADMVDDSLSHHQITQCRQLANKLGLEASIANSAALFRYPESVPSICRPGIVLYGASPFAHRSANALGLAVTQRFVTRLIAINEVAAGESIGYGSRWQASRDSRIGVIAVGYGDGYPRHAPDGTPVAVVTPEGVQHAAVAGRVSMDMTLIDVTDIPSAKVGNEVELWGDYVSADDVAAACGTISYELFCQVTARPERVWDN